MSVHGETKTHAGTQFEHVVIWLLEPLVDIAERIAPQARMRRRCGLRTRPGNEKGDEVRSGREGSAPCSLEKTPHKRLCPAKRNMGNQIERRSLDRRSEG